MKKALRAAALLLLIFLLGTTAYAAEDCYTFVPPEGYALAEGQTALWTNAAQTANINIIVEKSDGVNPFDLTDEDIARLRDATAQAFADGLANYDGKVSNITAQTVSRDGMPVLCIKLDSGYTVEGVALTSRQVQYIFFTKEHSIYVTGTVLTDFADEEAELSAFDAAVAAMELHDKLYTEATQGGSLLVVFVVIGAIVGGAGGLALFLLRQRKKAEQAPQETQEAK